MNELKEKLAALGIGEDKIDGTIDAVVAFFKDKLPDSMSGMVDSIMNGESPDLGGDVLDKVKGFFGS